MLLPPETSRLRFREWRDPDIAVFEMMNKDAETMRYFPALLTTEQTRESAERIRVHFDQHGFGLYAVEKKDNLEFIGFIGFSTPRFEASFTPCIEMGWRLSRSNWGNGYATEGANACLDFGFSTLVLAEIFSFTSVLNKRSEQVMIKTGMKKAGEFEHPMLADGDPLKKHVLYRKKAEDAAIR